MKTVTPMSCAPNETRCRDYGTNTNSDPCELLSCGILGTSKELPGIPTPCGNNDAAYAGQKDKKRKKKTNDSATYVAQKEMDKWVRPSAKIGAEFSVSGQSGTFFRTDSDNRKGAAVGRTAVGDLGSAERLRAEVCSLDGVNDVALGA